MHLRLLAIATLVGLPAVADADVLSLRVEAHGGGAAGHGLGGDSKDVAFADGVRAPAYGALIGAEVLFVDAWIEHRQLRTDGATATWTQFMTGLDLDLDLGTPATSPGATTAPRPRGYVELGLGFGFGVGTGQQVELPLDNSEITDKGFLAEARLGAGVHLARVLSLGVVVPVSAGYFFKSGAGVVNDTGTHYQSMQAAVLVNLRFRIKVK